MHINVFDIFKFDFSFQNILTIPEVESNYIIPFTHTFYVFILFKVDVITCTFS